MALPVLVHAAHEGPCVLGRVLQAHGHDLRIIRLDQGQPVPADLDNVQGLIVMGGNMNVGEVAQYPWLTDETAYIRQVHEAGLPVVGICLGAQLIAAALGGEVAAMSAGPEIGFGNVRQSFPGTIDTLHAGIAWNTVQFHMHGQEVPKLPPDATPLSGSKLCKTQAFKVGLRTYAFQYHFEWDQRDIELMLQDPWLKQHAQPETIRGQMAEHFAGYRRVGDRLCENIVEYLFKP